MFNRQHVTTSSIVPTPRASLSPVPPLATQAGEIALSDLRVPITNPLALLSTDPIRNDRALGLQRRLNGLAREIVETIDRAHEASMRMEGREQDFLLTVARTEDQVSAIRANIQLREELLPDQIDLAREQFAVQIRALRGESAGDGNAAAADDFERLWVADDDLSVAARTAVVNATNGITQDTVSTPLNSFAAVVFANARERLRHHDRAVRETFLTLRSQLASGALGDDVQRAAARTLQDRTQEQRRAAGLGSIMGGLRGMAGGNGA